MRFQNPDEITAKPAFSDRRGMTIVELSIYALVASLVLAFFIFMFWRTRRVHEQQNIEVDFQRSFAMIREQLERDLTGCSSWKVQEIVGVGSNTSLFIDRIEGQIAYDVSFETGDIIRNTREGFSKFPFKSERESFLKTLAFAADQNKTNVVNLKISLKTVPSIEFTHDFSVRISDRSKEGFFPETDLKPREPEASAGIGQDSKPKSSCPLKRDQN